MVETLIWDSEFFGLNVGKAALKTIEDWDEKELDGYDLIYFFVQPENNSLNEEVRSKGALLLDEKVTFKKKVEKGKCHSNNIQSFHRTFSEMDEGVISLGLQSGIYSRFCLDSRIGSHQFEKLYRIWMNRSIDREIANEVLVYNGDELPIGVITIGEKAGVADIGVLAVDHLSRGRKVGRKLMEHAEYYCLEKGYSELQVITQKANTPACAFYENCGFSISSIVNIYHYWGK